MALERAPHEAESAYKLSLIEMHRRSFYRESSLAGADTSEAFIVISNDFLLQG